MWEKKKKKEKKNGIKNLPVSLCLRKWLCWDQRHLPDERQKPRHQTV